MNGVGGRAGKFDICPGYQEHVLNIFRVTGVFVVDHIGVAAEVNVSIRDNGGFPASRSAGSSKIAFDIKKAIGDIATSGSPLALTGVITESAKTGIAVTCGRSGPIASSGSGIGVDISGPDILNGPIIIQDVFNSTFIIGRADDRDTHWRNAS